MASEAEDLEALFDSIAEGLAVTDAQPEPAAAVQAGTDEDDLEALFDSIAEQREVVAEAVPGAMPQAAGTILSAAVSDAQAESEESADLYAQVGRCTRHLHDAMRELGYDQMLMNSTSEFSSARGRLEYVAELTEKAAVKVLNAIEEGLPEEENLLAESQALAASWEQMFEGKMSVEEFKALAEQSRHFAQLAAQTAERQKARMMEIMMAQDFQDITGQIIKKIVSITQAHEQELMKILRDNAPEHVPFKQDDKPADLMSGPDLPKNALGQDDVDNLLADRGF